MEQISDRIAKLLSVKSIVTVILTVTYAVLSLRGSITGQEFTTVFSVIVAFYFGTQSEKAARLLGKAAEDGQ